MKKYALLSLVTMMLLLSGCQLLGNQEGNNDSGLTGKIVLDEDDFLFINGTGDADEDEPQTNESTTPEEGTDSSTDGEDLQQAPEDLNEEDVAYIVEVTEGELVNLDLKAVDPDGDELTYSYDEPLNAQGRWQTRIGDEGRYLATVTVSDGRLSTSEDVLLIINRANRPPVIECPDTFNIKETETLNIDCNVYDEEGDDVLISYEGWARSSTKETTYDDAGEYTVLIRASDGDKVSTKTVNVIVENVNRAPSIEPIDDITLMETNTARIEPTVADPDGDDITVSFSNPLNDEGIWRTVDGDAGTYEITVTASDGRATTTETFSITVTQINTAPVLRPIADITVNEGETITLPVNAYDPEGDDLIISYSGFMDSETYTTDFDDAGEYEQTVTVSDGVLSTSQTFTVTVEDTNRNPVFIFPGE